jgi:hypothetical protein
MVVSLNQSDTLKYYSDLNSFDLADFYEKNSLQNNIEPYVVSSRYYEIGSIKGIIDFENYIKLNETII